jgi:hypothetical protein
MDDREPIARTWPEASPRVVTMAATTKAGPLREEAPLLESARRVRAWVKGTV